MAKGVERGLKSRKEEERCLVFAGRKDDNDVGNESANHGRAVEQKIRDKRDFSFCHVFFLFSFFLFFSRRPSCM